MADASGPVGFAEPVRSLDHAPASPATASRDGSASSTLDPGLRRLAADRQARPKIPRRMPNWRPPRSSSSRASSPKPRKQFAKIAKNRKGTPWGETAQYYLAESQFQRGKYVDAHDSFEKLHTDYPATDYLDKLVSREYAIAQLWTLQDDPKAPKDKLLPWYGRFDGGLPIIDTQGYALKALEHVRHNDPTGAAGRRCRTPDRRILHEASRLRIGRDLLRPVHRRIPQEPVPSEGPARGDRCPDERLPRSRVRRVRPGESARAGQEDHGDLSRTAGQLRGALSHARRDQQRRSREDLPDRRAITNASARSRPPSFISARSPSAGPAAPGPSRPRSSWLNSPRCRERRPSPARS